jgi:hypothetical protein
LRFETLLQCNKLKDLKCDATKIKEAVSDSSLVELCEDNVSLRRKEAFIAPAPTKKVKTETQ